MARDIKIINIMPHGPAYHYAPDEKPDVYWEKDNGQCVGFWTREWPDLLGEAIVKVTDRYAWEVWQPDLRADKIYSKLLDTGVTHFLFPPEETMYPIGIVSEKILFSKAIIDKLEEIKNERIIVQLHGFRVPFYNELLKIFGPQNSFPFFLTGHGMSKAPVSELAGLHRPLTYLSLLMEHWQLKKRLQYVDVISEQSESALKEIRRIYEGRIEKLTMGCYFNYWTPPPSSEAKQLIRQKLKIPLHTTVFFATGNFVPRKQLDKLIKCFSSINRNDFFLLIAGHGDSANTTLLRSLIEPLIKQNRALLHPYIEGVGLRDLYWASDIYTSTSTDEGSSVAIIKAMACGLPILSTPVGETTELLSRCSAGRFIAIDKYSEWLNAITDVLDNGSPNTLDRKIARNAYDWSKVAQRFIKIYDSLVK